MTNTLLEDNMNIFFLDTNPQKAAQYHFDKHVNKMLLESAQLLSTTCHQYKWKVKEMSSLTDYQEYCERIAYKQTHINHPCSIWLRKSLDNWMWVRDLVYALNDEFKYRYNHIVNHSSYNVVKNLPIPPIEQIGITPPIPAMPPQYKYPNRISSYRIYYILDKRHLFGYTKRPIPHWWEWLEDDYNSEQLLYLRNLRDRQIIITNREREKNLYLLRESSK